jgi:hypothetical protein
VTGSYPTEFLIDLEPRHMPEDPALIFEQREHTPVLLRIFLDGIQINCYFFFPGEIELDRSRPIGMRTAQDSPRPNSGCLGAKRTLSPWPGVLEGVPSLVPFFPHHRGEHHVAFVSIRIGMRTLGGGLGRPSRAPNIMQQRSLVSSVY